MYQSNRLWAPRKIGPAESIGQGRRLLGQESQSVLPGQTGIFRGALKIALDFDTCLFVG